ncbi:copper homeostasis protein CutC [Dactylosporangium sp. NPDC049525]|uniref:copper homeostasis protein CutC n=1 Tax=Dactylosporangium sp. NPDC049525 TaxID=3154730 RepID=UPI00341626F9
MITPLLEVIALDAVDARHARDGGADRVELVSDMAAAGLSPTPATVAAVRGAVDLPVRVMLRTHAGFAAGDLDALRRTAKELRSAGAEEFVLGFLDPSGAVDLPAVVEVVDTLDGAPWTFHRAIDHAADRPAVWAALAGLPGLDTVLTSGAPAGLSEGLPTVLAEMSDPVYRPRLLVGGGLRDEHIGPLRAAGVTAFHSGSAVRRDRGWAGPVDPALVARLAQRLRSAG